MRWRAPLIMSTAHTPEQAALLANDLRVLVSQLNERVQEAARAGLQVEINASLSVNLDGDVLSYPTVSIRVTAEVR